MVQIKDDIDNKKLTERNLIKHFDKIFGTRNNEFVNLDISIIKFIYKKAEEELMTPNPIYQRLRKEHIKISNEFRKTLSKEQEGLFEKHLDSMYQMFSIENEQLFYFGWIMSKNINEQGIIK